MTIPKLISAELTGVYSILLKFSDGTVANVDFTGELTGGIFESLRDPQYFSSFTFQQQFGTIEWSNGADFAPEFLYELASSNRQQTTRLDTASQRKTA